VLQGVGHTECLVYTPQELGKFRLKPDVLIINHRGDVQTVLDTKWKKLQSDVENTTNGVAETNMYQMFAYAIRFHSLDNVLIFPAVAGVSAKEYRVIDGARIREIRIETVNLDRGLAAERPAFIGDLCRMLARGSKFLTQENVNNIDSRAAQLSSLRSTI
jgi:hypothetical protein